MSLNEMELYASSIVGYYLGFDETLWFCHFLAVISLFMDGRKMGAALGGLDVPRGLGVPLFEGSVTRDCGTAMRRLVIFEMI